MSKESYLLVQEAFHLPAATLESLYDIGGVCSDYVTDTPHAENEDRFGICFPSFL